MRLHVSNSLLHFSISLLNCFELRDIVSFSNMLITEVVKILDRRIQFVRNCKTNKLKNENEEWCIVNFSTRGLNTED